MHFKICLSLMYRGRAILVLEFGPNPISLELQKNVQTKPIYHSFDPRIFESIN